MKKMGMPPGSAKNAAMLLDEPIGKSVGRSESKSPLDAYRALLRTVRPLTGGMTPFPRGVFRFVTHEEADEWTKKHILSIEP